MNERPHKPPEGYEFVDRPGEATHVWDVDYVVKELPCAYSRSLYGWLRKIDTTTAVDRLCDFVSDSYASRNVPPNVITMIQDALEELGVR